MKKTILLASPTVHGISELLEQNLRFCGFEVFNISRNDKTSKKFKFPSFWSWLKVRFLRDILKNKEARTHLESTILLNELKTILPEEKLDYALFFLAQSYSLEFLNYTRNQIKSGGMVNYQWDGLDRFPAIYTRLPIFDRTYVFDAQDLNKSKLIYPTTSFYFDFDLAPLAIEYDFYFLGAHRQDRAELMLNFTRFAEQKGWKINFNLLLSKKDENWRDIYPKNVIFLDNSKAVDFKDNLNAARKANILLDFVISEHRGLSLRVFEALGHNKKLITTNAEVKKYDFYHPNNIFVLENNFEAIESFLNLPYVEIDPKIKQKYSFSNWINYVLNIEPHQPIALPQ